MNKNQPTLSEIRRREMVNADDDREMTMQEILEKQTPDYIPVSCVKCGEPVGYVIATGHTAWLCETCGDGKFVAVEGQK